MWKQSEKHVIGDPVVSDTCALSYPIQRFSRSYFTAPKCSFGYQRKGSVLQRMNKLGKKADVFANNLREHVKLSPKISETVKGKLSLGARVLQMGGIEKVFITLFNVSEKERLIKASQCYLSTTVGPIAGILFISTQNIAFCSERSLKLSCPNGESIRFHYKVLIPLTKIERANESENMKRPSQKYMRILTVDNFDFWFMGFLNHQKTWTYLQQAISRA
ncbi:putative GEM-like protein 8 [Punica granatum]|uniref:GEM-like protein 8 n=1 Tax=Punica granatum TaxID=22663 RepID=A0A6P8CBK7_PUNGR|nr:putative GEM-like protein 8 [Punica granatum]